MCNWRIEFSRPLTSRYWRPSRKLHRPLLPQWMEDQEMGEAWVPTRNIAATYWENPSGLRSKLHLSSVLSHWKMKVYFFKQLRLINTLLRSLKFPWPCRTHWWQDLHPPSCQLCSQSVRQPFRFVSYMFISLYVAP